METGNESKSGLAHLLTNMVEKPTKSENVISKRKKAKGAKSAKRSENSINKKSHYFSYTRLSTDGLVENPHSSKSKTQDLTNIEDRTSKTRKSLGRTCKKVEKDDGNFAVKLTKIKQKFEKSIFSHDPIVSQKDAELSEIQTDAVSFDSKKRKSIDQIEGDNGNCFSKKLKKQKTSYITKQHDGQCRTDPVANVQEKVDIKSFSKREKEKYPIEKIHKGRRKRKSNKLSHINVNDDDDEDSITNNIDNKGERDNGDDDDEDEDSNNEWEEVSDGVVDGYDDDDDYKPKRPIQDVEVIVQKTKKGKKTPEEMMQDEIRCAINRMKMTTQKYCHQVHLLCFLSSGMLKNRICNDMEMKAIAYSYLPLEFLNTPIPTWEKEFLKEFVTWFRGFFSSANAMIGQLYRHSNSMKLIDNLKDQLQSRTIQNVFEFSLIFVIVSRSLGLNTRLVHSFEPITSKAPDLLKKSSSLDVLNVIKKRKFNFNENSSQKNKKLKNSGSSQKNSGNKVKNSSSKNPCSKNSLNKNVPHPASASRFDSRSSTDNSGQYDNENSTSCQSADNLFEWWSEIYLEKEKRWIFVNGNSGDIDDIEEARKSIKKPFSYVLAYDNGGFVKDLTSRYDANWLLVSCRKRVELDWWKSVLDLYKNNQSIDDACEDSLIQDDLFKQPLPTSISAYKNHPLYVLKRHLLKFECIYPSTSVILGYVRDEPVYSRDCVHQLHSKEKWTVEGRVVKDGEEPYKVVKRRPKTNKKMKPIGDENLDLFGRWQTEQFVPKPAVDGIVPKNEFGNVEIFKPWMIPPGTVLIEESMPGLSKLAKKLEIDVAPAMLGWEFHRNVSAPILRGWVVCEEKCELLTSAWQEEQIYLMEKEREKRTERILGNWRKLIRGLLIRERVKDQYGIEAPMLNSNLGKQKRNRRFNKDVLYDDLTESCETL